MNYAAIIDEHVKTLELCRTQVSEFCQQAVEICNEVYRNNKHLYICGNGGSAADATHIVGELVGRLRQDRIPFPATCLGADFATMTAVSNDYGYDKIFAREVIAKVRPHDVLWCLSTSGNSANVINAVEEARKVAGVKIIGMSGKSGGKLKDLSDICLCVPNTFADRIQEIHQIAYHLICQGIEEYLLQKDSQMRWLLLYIFLCIGCSPSTTKPQEQKNPSPPISLEEHVATSQKIVEKYETTGELVSVHEATLSAEVSGQIISRPIYVGDSVKKNQLLLSLDKELLEIEKHRLKQNIILEKARADEARSNLIRQQKLGIATTPQQLEKATTNYTIVQQNLAILQQNLRKVMVNINKTTIRAPFTGEISKVFVNENEFAQTSQPLVTVTDRSTLKVVTGVPENIITKLSKNSEVQIFIPSIRHKYRSTIFCTYPVMNANTKKIPVEIRIANNKNFLYSGMFCRLYFRVAITKGIVIPFKFVKVAYDMYFVKVIHEKQVTEKRVAATLHKDGWLIERGIKVGQKIQEY